MFKAIYNFMVALTLKGTYQNGQFFLDQPVNFAEQVEIVVIFLQPKQAKKINPEKFSFRKSLELISNAKGSLSSIIIEERRAEKW